MKKGQHIKQCGLLMLLLGVCLLMLSGCHAHYEIEIAVTGKTADDCNIDILLPLEEELAEHISYESERVFPNGGKGKYPLAGYCEDGYRSALVHYCGDYSTGTREADDGFTQIIALNGKKEYLELCRKYKTFRLAEYDKNGQVLYVSEPYELIGNGTDERVYTDGKWEYDAAAHTLKMQYVYERAFWVFFVEILAAVMIYLSPIPCVVFVGILVLLRAEAHEPVPRPGHIVACSLLWMQVPVYLLCRLDYALKTHAPVGNVLTDLLDLNFWARVPDTLDDILFVGYVLIPVFTLAGLGIWMLLRERREKQKAQT